LLLTRDGTFTEVVVTVLNGPPEIWMNRSRNRNHWIILKLVGVKSNRDGLGTKVKVTTSLGSQYNQATTVDLLSLPRACRPIADFDPVCLRCCW
jgi:hypothetical protein